MNVNETSLRDAIIEYIGLVDRTQNHIHLRVTRNGECYVSEDTSFCIGEDEFNRLPSATITVKHEQGNGQCNLADGWTSDDEGIETIQALTDSILEDLAHMGVDCELT